MIANVFFLNGWRVDADAGRISRGDITRHLEPQVMRVLTYLAGRSNAVVSREELFNNVWKHSFVSDAALTRCIFEIRRAFGDDAHDPTFIETIPKLGFRLIAIPTAPRVRRFNYRIVSSLSVAASFVILLFLIPFESGRAPVDSSTTGQVEAVRTYDKALVHFARHNRISNESAIILFEKAIELDPTLGRAYAGLANALGLQSVLWGGNRIADARRAAEIAMQISPRLPQTHNAAGLVLELSGDYEGALASFQYARQLDPRDVDSMIYAANIHKRSSKFRNAAEMYLQIVDRVPNHRVAIGQLAFVYLRMGDLSRAREWINRGIDNEPFDPDTNFQLAALEMVTGNLSVSIEICEKIQQLYPNHKGCLQILGRSNLVLGSYDEAMKWFQLTIDSFAVAEYAQLGQAQVLIANNQVMEGNAIVENVLRRATAAANMPAASWWDYWAIAACHSLKGDIDSAFVWLDRAAYAGRRFYLWDAEDTAFSALHGDPRFERYISLTKFLTNTTS